jgi:hypothetical protein
MAAAINENAIKLTPLNFERRMITIRMIKIKLAVNNNGIAS